jgi:hypothetical protein
VSYRKNCVGVAAWPTKGITKTEETVIEPRNRIMGAAVAIRGSQEAAVACDAAAASSLFNW